MGDKPDTPIYSARDEDVDVREEISDFVIHLAERVDLLQDVEGGADFGPLEKLARDLASESERFGFDLLAEVSLRVVAGCEEQKADVVQDSLVELTDVARRIRLGHRGAA